MAPIYAQKQTDAYSMPHLQSKVVSGYGSTSSHVPGQTVAETSADWWLSSEWASVVCGSIHGNIG